MKYHPEDFIQLSALRHYVYCPRLCALTQQEMIWEENVYTAEGRVLHEAVDTDREETRKDVKRATGLLLKSAEHGVCGRADMVEFHLTQGVWRPYPVEFKRGRPQKHDAARVQLCMQALCLEEMLGVDVPEGAIFYGKTRRREVVPFCVSLRSETLAVIGDVRVLFGSSVLPPPAADSRCDACSLREHCLPDYTGNGGRARTYLESLLDG